MSILAEEVGEAAQQANEVHFDPTGCLDKEGLLLEVTQVAAVAVAIIEHLLEDSAPQRMNQILDVVAETKAWWDGPLLPSKPTMMERANRNVSVEWNQ